MNTLFYRNLVFCRKPIDFFHSSSAPLYPCNLGDVAHLLTLQSVRIRQSKQAETIRVSKHPRRLGLTNNNYLNYSSLRQNFFDYTKNVKIKFSYFLSLYNFRIFVKIIRFRNHVLYNCICRNNLQLFLLAFSLVSLSLSSFSNFFLSFSMILFSSQITSFLSPSSSILTNSNYWFAYQIILLELLLLKENFAFWNRKTPFFNKSPFVNYIHTFDGKGDFLL